MGKKRDQKRKILIVRDAAVGDCVMVTPLIRSWSERGWEVHVACKRYSGEAVFAGNPHVTRCWELSEQPTLGARRDAIKRIRDKLQPDIDIDLVWSCEGAFLYHSDRPEYRLPLEWRRMNARGKNYYRHICVTRGGGDRWRPEMYASAQEDAWWCTFRARHLGWKFVQVQLSGSSLNKIYPWWPMVVRGLQDMHPRLMVITTGEPHRDGLLEMGCVEYGCDPKRMWATCSRPGRWTMRDSLITTKYVDLVIAPETGVLNAAACWDTPKIALLTHSTAENLCSGWENWYPIQSPAECSPCYRIVSAGDEDDCPRVTEAEDSRVAGALRCMAAIEPQMILDKAREALGLRNSMLLRACG